MKKDHFLLKIIKVSIVAICIILLIGASAYTAWRTKAPRNLVGEISRSVNAPSELVLFLVGDTGTGRSKQKSVAMQMEKACKKLNPQGLVLLGDMAYQNGVKSLKSKGWKKKIFGPYDLPCLMRVTKYPVLGNHDYKGNPLALIQKTYERNDWYLPHRFYQVDFEKKLRLTTIDTSVPDWCFDADRCSLDFLKESLNTSTAQFNLVVAHKPIISSTVKYFNSEWLFRKSLNKLICEKADIYASGHAHIMEHLRQPGCKTELFISGGGGGKIDKNLKKRPESLFVKSEYGFGIIKLTDESLRWDFVNEHGETVYHYQL